MKEKRSKDLAEKIVNIIAKSKHLAPYHEMVDAIMDEGHCKPKDVAAALAYLMHQSNPIPDSEMDLTAPEFERRRKRPAKGRGKPSSRPRHKNKGFADAPPPKKSGKKKAKKRRVAKSY